MTGNTVESVIESFSTSVIIKIEGKPIYKAIKAVEKQIIANTLSYESELGRGNHGLLGLIIIPNRYQIITGHVFFPYNNLGVLPVFPPNPT